MINHKNRQFSYLLLSCKQ